MVILADWANAIGFFPARMRQPESIHLEYAEHYHLPDYLPWLL